MQIYRTFRTTLLLLALLVCLAAFTPPALAQQAAPPDTEQTKTGAAQPTATAAPAAQTTPALTLASVQDDQGLLALLAPPAWSDVTQGEWLIAGAPAGRKLSASPNQAEFAANWGTPGITVYYSTSLPAAMDPEDLLAVFDFSAACQDAGRGSLPPAERSAIYQIWQNCAATGTAVAVLVIYPPAARNFYAVIEVYLAGVDDLRALPGILAGARFGIPVLPETGATTAEGAVPPAEAVASPTLPPPTPEPAPAPAPVFATVITERLNLRSGPSTAVERLTVVTRGVQLTVVGQIDNCAWLRVTAPDGAQGWVSGDPQFTTLSAACETIPLAENPS